MTLEQGDPFEVTHATWLRHCLPTYEHVWRDFIGHNGYGQPLPIRGLTDDQETRRRSFYQAHYTVALRCLSIDELMQQADNSLGMVQDDEQLRHEFTVLNWLICDIGQVRDMFGKMDSALKLGGNVVARLQEFYYLRSHILHGPQMPYVLESDFLKIPLIATENKTAEEWDDGSHWDNSDPRTFVYARDFCLKTGNDFFDLINEIHPAIHAGACSFFGGKKVDWTQRQFIQDQIRKKYPNMQLNLGIGSGNKWMTL